MSNIKRLNLDYWMTCDWTLDDVLSRSKDYEPYPAVIGIPGIYLALNACWFELPDGRAFTYPASMFRYMLDLLDASRMNHHQVEALRGIVKQKLATKEQRDLLYRWSNWYENREVGRSALRMRLQVLGK